MTRRQIVIGGAIVVALVAVTLIYRTIDVAALHVRAQSVDGVLVFALVTVLPLIAFPVSVTQAITGVRFGFGLGMALATVSLVLQLLASYALVKAKPKLFARPLKSLVGRLPKGAHSSVTQFTMLLPGVPYFAQIYVLPLVGVPLGVFLRWSIPIQMAKSAIGVLFGHMSDNLTLLRIAGFATYAIVVTAGCTWAFRRLRKRMETPAVKIDGRKKRKTVRPAAAVA